MRTSGKTDIPSTIWSWLSRVNRYVGVALALWSISMLLLFASGEQWQQLAGWAVAGPMCILFCWMSIARLIPESGNPEPRFWKYLKNALFFLLVTYIPVAMLLYLLLLNLDVSMAIAMLIHAFVLLFGIPFSWFIYKRNIAADKTIRLLRTELGQSEAHFDFLRSQINPHFLFNTLNTIYGLALQENATQTSTAVEKLSGMMRFMLRENMEEWIPLDREIEYLQNYISLQRLRISGHSAINFNLHIEEPVPPGSIAPMLLIPFVENAFKHGVSYMEPSYIRISLQVRNGQLQFDVANSKHEKQALNREHRAEGGIGVENVRQRLKLLYGEDHELMLRETARDYFVHLNLPIITKHPQKN